MGYLYRLDFPNGKSYIGITFKTPEARFKEHTGNVKDKSNLALYSAWKKYGKPVLITLAEIEDCDLLSTEIRAISVFNTKSPNGYNLTNGGDGVFGHVHSAETREKLRLAHTGRKLPPEHREKLSAVLKQQWASGLRTGPTEKAKAALASRQRENPVWLGRKHTPESVEKMRKAQLGKTHTPETRAKLSQINRGKKIPPDVVEKCAAKHRGLKRSEETRAKMRAAWVLRKQRAQGEVC